jgi:hypothetical protein
VCATTTRPFAWPRPSGIVALPSMAIDGSIPKAVRGRPS